MAGHGLAPIEIEDTKAVIFCVFLIVTKCSPAEE